MKEKSPKNVDELLKTITPPKGVKGRNIEGTELYDCDGDEIMDEVENEVLEASDDEIESTENVVQIWYDLPNSGQDHLPLIKDQI